MNKQQVTVNSQPEWRKESLGISPAVMAKRKFVRPGPWCPRPDIEFDAMCDAYNPKTILYKDIHKANAVIRQRIAKTPMVRSKCCVQLGFEVNYKFETFHKTGSFHERGAYYALKMLNEDQRQAGIFTASIGNWGRAIAFQAHQLKIPVTIVLPENTACDTILKCQDFGAKVVVHGENLAEAKKKAFILLNECGKGTYLNGYDHPNVIAASGSIGVEILEQLPQTDAILIPVGGGGLIAGVATVVKYLKPEVLIYGIEPIKCCTFFKALENEGPYKTEVGQTLAESLAVPTAGYNAFHTAQSLIDKMVLVDDNWISRAILHLAEEEKVVAEGAGATSLSALLTIPNVVSELKGKTVVCIISGGNVDNYSFPIALERAKAVEGRLVRLVVKLRADDTKTPWKILSIISNVGANIRDSYIDHGWLIESDFSVIYLNLTCETQGLEHACTLKRVLCRIFPNICEFVEESFSPIPICSCFPRRVET